MKGLSFRKTADAIRAFVRKYGAVAPRRAVLCTYDLDPVRFEAVVLPELTGRRRWFRTLVIADQAQLQKTGVLSRRGAGATYELAPVRLRGSGVFHPKLVVLQAGGRLLVGIGSANLTPGGLGGNLELMLFASNDSADGQPLAASAIQFLYELSRARGVLCPESSRRFLERVCASTPRLADGPIAHSLERPLIEILAASRPPGPVDAAVVSPWHSSTASPQGVEPGVLRALTRAFGTRPTVFTEGQGGKGPALGARVSVRILKASVADPSDEFEAGESAQDGSQGPKRPASLHAKAYLAARRRGATLWFGSANCTSPALLRTVGNGGNVELLVRVQLGKVELARVESDLAQMFEAPRGVAKVKDGPRIPSPRGVVLAGYVSGWQAKPRIKLELVEARTRSFNLWLSRTGKSRDAISVNVPGGETSVCLARARVGEVLGGEGAPSVLWEHVGAVAVAFPVSVGCISDSEDPEEQLDDLLDELKGRVPAPLRSRKRRPSDDAEGGAAGDEEDEEDAELALLTKTKHQGILDRIAVRVELLRRRLASSASTSEEALVHYRRVVDKLVIDESLRSILAEHLGSARRAP